MKVCLFKVTKSDARIRPIFANSFTYFLLPTVVTNQPNKCFPLLVKYDVPDYKRYLEKTLRRKSWPIYLFMAHVLLKV